MLGKDPLLPQRQQTPDFEIGQKPAQGAWLMMCVSPLMFLYQIQAHLPQSYRWKPSSIIYFVLIVLTVLKSVQCLQILVCYKKNERNPALLFSVTFSLCKTIAFLNRFFFSLFLWAAPVCFSSGIFFLFTS